MFCLVDLIFLFLNSTHTEVTLLRSNGQRETQVLPLTSKFKKLKRSVYSAFALSADVELAAAAVRKCQVSCVCVVCFLCLCVYVRCITWVLCVTVYLCVCVCVSPGSLYVIVTLVKSFGIFVLSIECVRRSFSNTSNSSVPISLGKHRRKGSPHCEIDYLSCVCGVSVCVCVFV